MGRNYLLVEPRGVNGVAVVENPVFLEPGSNAGVKDGDSTFRDFFELFIKVLVLNL